jgi:hypothetical protein
VPRTLISLANTPIPRVDRKAGQLFTRVFIDYGQAFQLLTIGTGIVYKVITPK